MPRLDRMSRMHTNSPPDDETTHGKRHLSKAYDTSIGEYCVYCRQNGFVTLCSLVLWLKIAIGRTKSMRRMCRRIELG